MTQVLAYRYRLLPTRTQHLALREILESQRQLYNAALEERISCYRATGNGRSYFDQCKALTECRATLPDMAALPLNLQRATLKRIDDAYKGFFRHAKSGGKAGFPRFKGKGWFDSFGFREFDGITYDLIAVEALNVKGLASGLLARAVNDAAWGKLLFMIGYKAERAGAIVRKVDPRNTTQECSGCQATVPKTLAQRVHSCSQCGLVLDRDVNAAKNILARAVAGPGQPNVTEYGVRAVGNVNRVETSD